MNYPDQQTKKNCCIVLMATLFVGVYLRFYGLAAQGFFFFDEGEMFLRAKLLKEVILNKHDLLIIGPSYVDTKVFWLFLISVGQTIFKGASYSAHYVSALLGVLSIVLTYLVASRIYNSPKISLFSAIFLTLSSSHVFYSRLALGESASCCLMLLSIFIYLCGRQKRDLTYYGCGRCFIISD